MADQYCIVGRDVSHSPSPAMMNAAFKSIGMEAKYTAVSAPETGFPREFRRLMSSRFKGMNVTMPFKTAVIPLLAGLDPVGVGAVS
jgi:shikimate dehydrogenase